ncbi:putative CmcJ-like methyltransferase [Nemania diffusa]|nr:putative CmcJ-like methyltransferase [Nemania diffusa]
MVLTSLKYLARDKLYEVEKPYSAEFEVEDDDGARKSNYVIIEKSLEVQPIERWHKFDLDTNGFCTITAETSLSATDALNEPESVETDYLAQLKVILAQHFPEYSRLEAFEFVVRQRDERFPSNQLAIITHEQPACLTHSDYSTYGARLQIESSFPRQERFFEGKEFDMINVWRPLIGPNDDWPLAVCDYTTIDVENDIISADRLHHNRVCENQLLFANEKHRWYYVKNQQPHNLLVFRNTDSSGQRASESKTC